MAVPMDVILLSTVDDYLSVNSHGKMNGTVSEQSQNQRRHRQSDADDDRDAERTAEQGHEIESS